MNLGTLNVIITATNTGLLAGLQSAGRAFDDFGKKIEAGNMNLKTFSLATGLLGTGLLTLTGVMAGTAIKAATDWQQQLVTIGNNAGMTSEQIAEMGNTVMQMSAQMGASKSDLMTAYMYIHDMGYAGRDATDILTAATKEALATGSSIADTASVLATAMHSFKIPVKDAATTIDMLHSAAASARMTMQDFMQSFGPVGAQAAAIGVPLNDASASMAALTRNGFDASMSATQVRDMLLHIMAPSKSARTELEALSGGTATVSTKSKDLSFKLQDLGSKLNIAGERVTELSKKHGVAASTMDAAKLRVTELNHEFQDMAAKATTAGGPTTKLAKSNIDLAYDFSQAGLKAKGLSGVLDDVKKATGGNAEEMNKLIPNLRGGLGALVLVNNGHKDLIDILNKEKNSLGSTEAAYALYSSTTGAQMARARESFENVQIAIGTALLPAVNRLLDALLPLLQRFAVWADQHPKLVAGIMMGVAALGALLLAISAITAILPALAVLFNPVTVAIAVFGQGVFRQIGMVIQEFQLLQAHWQEVSRDWQRLWSDAVGIIDGAVKSIMGTLDSLAKKASDSLSHLNPFAHHSPSLIEQVTSGVAQIQSLYQSLSGMNIKSPNMGTPNMGGLAGAVGGGMGGVNPYAVAPANNFSYQNINTPSNNSTINNTFNIKGDENAVGFAEYMGFQLEHMGIV